MYELYLCDFLFSNQIRYHNPETQPLSLLISSPLKMTCLPLSVSLLSPFSFKLRNSPLKIQHLVAFLPQLFKFSKNSGSIPQWE